MDEILPKQDLVAKVRHVCNIVGGTIVDETDTISCTIRSGFDSKKLKVHKDISTAQLSSHQDGNIITTTLIANPTDIRIRDDHVIRIEGRAKGNAYGTLRFK